MQTLPAFGNPFSALVVFGDSLEDNGNLFARYRLPPSPPYWEGRLSNGPMWVERLSDRLNLGPLLARSRGGTNYAWAGATTGSIRGALSSQVVDIDVQVSNYLANEVPHGDELFVISGGWNDLNQGQTDLVKIVQTISEHILNLRSAGAKSFIIVNIQANAGELAAPLNVELAARLANLRNEYDDIDIFELDHASMFDAVVADPHSFGFVSATTPACADCGVGAYRNPTKVVDNPQEYFLWDDVHPTAGFHQMLGDAAFRAVIPLGDFDLDRDLTTIDVDLLIDEINTGQNDEDYDLTGDRTVNNDDLHFWVKNLRWTYFGDANLDGEFNSNDFVEALAALTFESNMDAGWAGGDFDGNGRFDIGDLMLASTDGGYEKGPRPRVPEPSTSTMLLIAVAALAVRRRVSNNVPTSKLGPTPTQPVR